MAALWSKGKQLYLYHAKEEKMWALFYAIFKVIEAAGGIVRQRLVGNICLFTETISGICPKGE